MTIESRLPQFLDYADDAWAPVNAHAITQRSRRIRRRRTGVGIATLVALASLVVTVARPFGSVQHGDESGPIVTAAQLSELTHDHSALAPPALMPAEHGVTPVAWATPDAGSDLCVGWIAAATGANQASTCMGWGPPPSADRAVFAGVPTFQAAPADDALAIGFVTGDVAAVTVTFRGKEYTFATKTVLGAAPRDRNCGPDCTIPALQAYALWLPKEGTTSYGDADITSYVAKDAHGNVMPSQLG
jgi:hypothetical protein